MHLLIDADSLEKLGKVYEGPGGYLCCGDNQYVHRLVMEDVLGRPLLPGEVVHHKDENKLNARRDNLMVFASQAEHMKHHARERCEHAGYDFNTHKWCSGHKQYELRSEFSFASTGDGLYTSCRAWTREYKRQKGYKSEWTEERRQQQRSRRAAKKEQECTTL